MTDHVSITRNDGSLTSETHVENVYYYHERIWTNNGWYPCYFELKGSNPWTQARSDFRWMTPCMGNINRWSHFVKTEEQVIAATRDIALAYAKWPVKWGCIVETKLFQPKKWKQVDW